MVKLSMTRFRPVKFRMGQVHLKKGGLSCKGAIKAADLSQPDICCGPEPEMCCTICSRDQSFQDNYRKWVELRAKSSGTPDIKYRVAPAVLRPRNKQDRANYNDSYPSRTLGTAADQQSNTGVKRKQQDMSSGEQPKVFNVFVKREFVDATDGRSNKYVEELNEKLGDVLDRVAKAKAKVEKETELRDLKKEALEKILKEKPTVILPQVWEGLATRQGRQRRHHAPRWRGMQKQQMKTLMTGSSGV